MKQMKRGNWTSREDIIIIGECMLSLIETGATMPGAREAAKILGDRYISHCDGHFHALCKQDKKLKLQAIEARRVWREAMKRQGNDFH